MSLARQRKENNLQRSEYVCGGVGKSAAPTECRRGDW